MPLHGQYLPGRAHDDGRRVDADAQVQRYESSGGTEGTTLDGKPVIVLTTIGAKTGGLRKTPLMRVEHRGEYAVIASEGGRPKHPAWYFNLMADPRAELQDGPVKRDYVAREVTGDEKARWWAIAVEAWPNYDRYQERTERVIPLLVLTPTRKPHAAV
jgi:deazaflavin-dependent oxidoreductase (nitroreductase family)